MDSDSRKAIAGFWFFLSISIFVGFSIWFLLNGGFHEPWQQLVSFIRETEIKPQTPFWEVWNIVFGFVLLDFWLSMGIVLLLVLVIRRKPTPFFEKWKRLLNLPLLPLFYNLLGGVAAEEIVFRWFPLAILFPRWDTNSALWIVIIVSSLIFGLLHVFNQKPGERKLIFILPQIMSGVIFSYIFLSYGLGGAIAVHLIFDALFVTFVWVGYRIYPQFFTEQQTE